LAEYFTGIPFQLTEHSLWAVPNPASLILADWYAAVKYCKTRGVPAEAFLNDGTPLFKFAPDALPFVSRNREGFPGLDILRVNDGTHVEGWLNTAKIGHGQGEVPHDNWLVLLTGYTPQDNRAVSGLYQRYNEALLVTALAARR